MKKSELRQIIKEELQKVLSEAYVPNNVMTFAKEKGVDSLVKKVAGWAEKNGKTIVDGTAIGKNYSTLILDLTRNGAEIRINTDTYEVTLNGETINDARSFKKALESMTEGLSEAANKFTEGDKVKVITPSMSHSGKTGTIVDIAPSGSFYLVKFSSNQNAYFHESDLRLVKSPIA
jgi:ribosomal protein L21E